MIGRVFRQNKKGGKSGETVPLTLEGGEEAAAAGAGPAGGHQEQDQAHGEGAQAGPQQAGHHLLYTTLLQGGVIFERKKIG